MHTPATKRHQRTGRTLTIGVGIIAAMAAGLMAPATATATATPDVAHESAPTAEASDWTSSMIVEGSTFESGTTLDVGYTTDSLSNEDWIGLYHPGETPGESGVKSVIWDYTPGDSGTVSLNLGGVEPGEWVLWFLAEGSFAPLAQSITVTVVEGKTAEETSLTLNTSDFLVDERLTVDYQTDQPHASNWIGIYPEGVEPGPTPSTMWEYAPGSTGSVSFTLDLPPGTYDVWFLARDVWDPLTEKQQFTVTAPEGVAVPGDPSAPASSSAVTTDLSTDGVLLRETFGEGIPEGWTAEFGAESSGDAAAAAETPDAAPYAGWSETTRGEWSTRIDEMRDRFARTHAGFLVADAQQHGPEQAAAGFDATLTSAPVDVEFLRSLRLTFDSHFRGAEGQTGTVSARFDGGNWEEILTLDSETVTDGYDARQMNAMQDLPVDVPEGAESVQFAWNLTAGTDARYWGIDSVTVHQGALESEGASTNAWIVSDIQGHPHDFEHGLGDFNELMPDPAGLMMVGDIVNTGADWEWDEIYAVMDNTEAIRPDLTIASIGNHERYAPGGFDANRDRFLTFAGREDVYAEYVLEGPGGDLPVISIGQEFGAPSDVAMSDAQVEFLEERLAHWTAQGSQVVINTHFPLGNTVSASWIPHYSNHHQMNDRLTNILGNYPNAIIFAGHTHYPAEQGDWSMQRRTDSGHPDGFWAVSTIAMHNEWDAVGENTADIGEIVTGDINRGLTLESFGDRVVVTAHDFASDEELRQVTIANPLAPFAADEVPVDERPGSDDDGSGDNGAGDDGAGDDGTGSNPGGTGGSDTESGAGQPGVTDTAAGPDSAGLSSTGSEGGLVALLAAAFLALLGGGALVARKRINS